MIRIVTHGDKGIKSKLSRELCENWGGLILSLNTERLILSLDAIRSRSLLNAVVFRPIDQHREKTLGFNIRIWTWPDRLLTLISSTFVSDLYQLIQRIWCLICIGPYFIVTVQLVQHRVITNGPVYCGSYFYAAWLLIMNLSPTL